MTIEISGGLGSGKSSSCNPLPGEWSNSAIPGDDVPGDVGDGGVMLSTATVGEGKSMGRLRGEPREGERGGRGGELGASTEGDGGDGHPTAVPRAALDFLGFVATGNARRRPQITPRWRDIAARRFGRRRASQIGRRRASAVRMR